jgi:hypothetical protein
MNEEILKLLKLVEEKKVSPEEACDILETIYQKKEEKKKKNLIIKVISNTGDKVNLKIPLSLAKISKSFIPATLKKYTGDDVDSETIIKGIDEILENIDNIDSDIINVDTESGDIVRIYVE